MNRQPITTRYVKKYSTSIIFEEMKTKTKVRHPISPVSLHVIRFTKDGMLKDLQKWECLHTTDGYIH